MLHIISGPKPTLTILFIVVQAALDTLEAALAPFVNKTPAEIEANLDATQRARVYGALSRASAVLFSAYLKSKGTDPSQHPFRKELERLKQYNNKVRKLSAADELNKQRRGLELNVDTANRFIAAALNADLTPDQKQQLLQRNDEEGGKKKKHSGSKKRKSDQHEDPALAFLRETLHEVKQQQQHPSSGDGGGEAPLSQKKKSKKTKT